MQVCLFLCVWMASTLVEASNFNLTTTSKTDQDGLLCPETTTWTCTGVTQDSVVRWWLVKPPGRYNEIMNNNYPGVVVTPMMPPPAESGMPLIGKLTGDPYKFQEWGYSILACGTYSDNVTYTIPKLDIEKPKLQILSIDTTYDGESHTLRALTVTSASKVYQRQSCMYRKSAFFNTTVTTSGTEVLQHKVTPLHSPKCRSLGCPTKFTFNGTILDKFLIVTTTVEDSIHKSDPFEYIVTSVQSAFMFQVKHRNCRTLALCSTLGYLAEEGTCNIRYTGTHGNTDMVNVPVNKDTPLNVATETNYTVEAVIAHGLETIHLRETFHGEKNSWQCVVHLEVLLGATIVTLLLICPCSLAVILLCAYKRKKRKSQRGQRLGEPSLLLELSATEKEEEENDYAQLELASKYSAFEGGNENYSLLQVETTSYDVLQRNKVQVATSSV